MRPDLIGPYQLNLNVNVNRAVPSKNSSKGSSITSILLRIFLSPDLRWCGSPGLMGYSFTAPAPAAVPCVPASAMVARLPLPYAGDEYLAGICSVLVRHMLGELKEIGRMLPDHGLSEPSCSLLLVGQHPAAVSYTLSTVAAARVSGAVLDVQRLSEETTQEDLLHIIGRLNSDNNCHGIVLQLPLPAHLDASGLVHAIADDKDIDGLKAASIGRLPNGSEHPAGPCIAAAIEEVLRSLNVLPPVAALSKSPPKSPPKSPHKTASRISAVPHVLLLSVPPLLSFPLALSLEASGCRATCLGDDQPVDAVRAELPHADVLLIGARRPDVVAAQYVRTGCVLLDLGLSTSAAPTPLDLHADSSADSSCLSDDSSGGDSPAGTRDDGSRGGVKAEGGGSAEGYCAGSGGAAPAAAPPTMARSASREVLCLCCSDGLSAMTAALRMRHLSHTALLQQNFLEHAGDGKP